jgi:hypothetical protein
MRTEALFDFIQERYAIRQRRESGLPKPWTQDPILQNYRFCNVYREHDTVTQWIAENWRQPNYNDPDVWFAMAVARFVNWPDTLAEVGYPVPWDEPLPGFTPGSEIPYTKGEHFVNMLSLRHNAGEKVWTGAYIIHAGNKGGSKIGHIAYDVLTALWERRDYIREATDSCAHFQKRLTEFEGLGNFMAGQIVCDTKYTALLDKAPDWWSFAVEGPGSKRGLNRVFNRPVNQNWKKDEWFVELHRLKASLDSMIMLRSPMQMPPMHAQDLQNCLCEFDKYERVRLGEGRPRNNYPGIK